MLMARMPLPLLVLGSLLRVLVDAGPDVTTLKIDGKVHLLTETNFSAGVRKYPYIFVEFYAPWCSSCKHLEPEWEKAAKIARTYDVPVAKVDVSTEAGGTMAQEHGVKSTPTLILFKGDPSISAKYPVLRARDAHTISDWLGSWVEGE